MERKWVSLGLENWMIYDRSFREQQQCVMLAEIDTLEFNLLHGRCYNWFLANIDHRNFYGCVSNRLELQQGLGTIEFSKGGIGEDRQQFNISWIDGRFFLRRLKLGLDYEALAENPKKSNMFIQKYVLGVEDGKPRFVEAEREAIMAQNFVEQLEGHLKLIVQEIYRRSESFSHPMSIPN